MNESEEKASVLLASGGLDSTVLAYWLRKNGVHFRPVFIDYGQHCAAAELATLKRVLPADISSRIQCINVGDIYAGSSSRMIAEADLWQDHVEADDLYLPYRNLLLLSIGSAYAQAHGYGALYSAFINSNHAKEIDCSAEFFGRLDSLLSEYGSVRVEMPFREYSKSQVARLGIKLGVPIGATYSCQVSSNVPCGVCPNCVDRLDALEELFAVRWDEIQN
ncbi:MAG: 7-cyano-7-deazaguanine synthase [Planctomycetota bacterium]|nr:MAG: 7-cyano-7-deazaguanine synthase [Planctomycetota bacterium]REK25972.1 MAG: 7-cyano-7-deazaguanine synthase [Planctomycetota bacterium]REK46912.1 MAG: 7-cyano-7-deazaguanine synthase [Planctomycetota bacterium]